MRDRDNNLAGAVARIQAGGDPDAVVAALHTSCDGHGAVVPGAYLEPLPRSARLRRSPAGLLLDLCARTCADARAIGERLTVFAGDPGERPGREAIRATGGIRAAGDLGEGRGR